jgi:phosphatidylglycerol:prolipoprotein diacylglycerol transferase
MFPILNIGPLAIQVPGLVLILGLYLGLSLAERYSNRHNISPNTLYNLVFIVLIAGVAGARLTYILHHPDAFAGEPLNILSLNPALLDLFGGIVGATLASIIYGQRQNLTLWSTLDALTPAFAVFSVALGLSHLASGNAFGAPTDLPWGIELWGTTRHPSQIYETIAAIIILVLLWPSQKYIKNLPQGTNFLTFIALSSFASLFLEAFRGNSMLLPGGFRFVQIVAWMVLAASLFGLYRISQNTDELPESIPTS